MNRHIISKRTIGRTLALMVCRVLGTCRENLMLSIELLFSQLLLTQQESITFVCYVRIVQLYKCYKISLELSWPKTCLCNSKCVARTLFDNITLISCQVTLLLLLLLSLLLLLRFYYSAVLHFYVVRLADPVFSSSAICPARHIVSSQRFSVYPSLRFLWCPHNARLTGLHTSTLLTLIVVAKQQPGQ